MKRHPQSDLVWNELRNPACTTCELHKEAQTVCLLGDGPVPCDIMVIGEAPGYREDNVEIPFSGKSGIYLRKCLREIGIDPRQVFITNAVACRPPGNRTPKVKEIKTCAHLYLYKQIEIVKPKVIMALGNSAIQALTGRKATVTKMEGNSFQYQGITCIPCRHPSSILRVDDPKDRAFVEQKFKENLLIIKRFIRPSSEKEIEFSQNFYKYMLEVQPGPVYTDIETNGLDPFRPDAKIWCASFAQDPKNVCATEITKSHEEEIKFLLKNHSIIPHRGTFEGIWYRWHYGITPMLYHDTKLGAFLEDENAPTGLKYQAVTKLHVQPWSEGTDFMSPDMDKLLPYNAKDAQYGLRLYKERQLPFLKRNPRIAKLLRYILLPAQEVFIEVICNGFHINMKVAQERLEECHKHMAEEKSKLCRIAGKSINPGSPQQMKWLFFDHLNLPYPKEAPRTKMGDKSTSEATMIRMAGEHEAVDIILEWRKWKKFESTYIVPWMRQGPAPHANYGFTDTDTGRLNSKMVKNKRNEKKTGGTIHQCPRDKFIRTLISPRGYVPPMGAPTPLLYPLGLDVAPKFAHPEEWCILAADLSQIELRLVAQASGDATMIAIFRSGGDIHFETALTIVEDASKIDEETRKKAKAVNFGFVYGMWFKKFKGYALEKFNVKLSMKESKNYREGFFNKYDGLLPWHRRVEAFVTANGFMDSLLGRRRHLPTAMFRTIEEECPECRNVIHPNCFLCGGAGVIVTGNPTDDEWKRKEAVRQAINSPIQSAGSDLLLFIVALIASRSWRDTKDPLLAPHTNPIMKWDFKVDKTKAFPVGSAHDSALFESHLSYVKTLRDGIKWTVANLPLVKLFDVHMKVPILMDVDVYKDCWKGEKLLI